MAGPLDSIHGIPSTGCRAEMYKFTLSLPFGHEYDLTATYGMSVCFSRLLPSRLNPRYVFSSLFPQLNYSLAERNPRGATRNHRDGPCTSSDAPSLPEHVVRLNPWTTSK